MLRLFFFFILTGILHGFSNEKAISAFYGSSSKQKKKYNCSVCAIFSAETKYLKEWIEYHELIGIDHFYLYKNGGDSSAKKLLKPFIKRGLVTFISWNESNPFSEEPNVFIWPLSTQISAYENAIYVRGLAETKWLVCLDINEYLVPPKNEKVGDFLEQYADYSGFILSTDCFDSSWVSRQSEIQLLIENKMLVAPPKEHLNRKAAKMIFKPEACDGFVWPPYQCRFKDDHKITQIGRSELRINRYVHQEDFHLENLKRRLYVDNRILSEREIFDALKQGYEIEDQELVIERFLPLLRKKMGLSKPWE